MAVDYYLKLDGIEGESIKKGHEKEIDIFSFSWGVHNPSDWLTGTGGATGKGVPSEISISKVVDKSSPKLMLHCCNGAHIKEGTVTMRITGDKEQALEYEVWKLSKLTVASIHHAAGMGDQKPMESVSFKFMEIKLEYKPQKDDGTLDAAIPFGWNFGTDEKA